MPEYRYEHQDDGCSLGKTFLVRQSMKEAALTSCPECGKAVERIIGVPNISSPTSDTDLRDKGFAKLVRRDKGVYENVTATEGESKFWHADKPETMPNIRKRISD